MPTGELLIDTLFESYFTATGGFWEEIGAGVNLFRYPDRVFIGAATDNDGRLVNIAEDWLEVIREDTVSNSQLAVLSRIGQQAILGASRTSDFDVADSMGCMGVTGWAINDNAAYPQTAYAGYFEARREAGCGWTHGIEIDVGNWGNEVDVLPFAMFGSGATFNLWLAANVGPAAPVGGNDVSVALGILDNGSQFKRGIVFKAEALENNDGVTGAAEAIVLPKGDAIIWYYTGNMQGFQINCQVDAATSKQSLQVANEGIYFENDSDLPTFLVNSVTGTITGYLAVTPSTAAAPLLSAVGSATDIDLLLAAKGTGLIRFGTYSAKGAEAFDGFIVMKDYAGNSRKIMTCA